MLLTDVEGSTQIWEQHPDAMRRSMERHEALVRDAIERHGGYRPPDQGEGDSVFAVFARASDAVACALEFPEWTACRALFGSRAAAGSDGAPHRRARAAG
jgi:class 3 adenylate cyclase